MTDLEIVAKIEDHRRQAVEVFRKGLREKMKERIHKLELMKIDGYRTGDMILELQTVLTLIDEV